jgi:hypothetical protein
LTVIKIHATIPHVSRSPDRPSAPASPRNLCALCVSALSSSCSFDFSQSAPNRSFRQSPYQYHSKAFGLPLFSCSYALFCTTQNAICSRFNLFHTLCTKHPGWRLPVSALRRLAAHLSCVRTATGATRFLSWSYFILLWIPPGGGGQVSSTAPFARQTLPADARQPQPPSLSPLRQYPPAPCLQP